MGDIKVVPRKPKEKTGEKLVGVEPDWTPKRTMAVIRAALRSIWSRSPQRLRVLESFREGAQYRCSECKKLHETVDIDHIYGAGELNQLSDLPGFVERLLFVKDEDLRSMCHACHSIRSTEENAARKKKLQHS